MSKSAMKKHLAIVDNRSKLFMSLLKYLPNDWAGMVDLAEQADVSPVTLWQWNAGVTVSPQINTLVKVASALGFDIELVKTRHLKLVRK